MNLRRTLGLWQVSFCGGALGVRYGRRRRPCRRDSHGLTRTDVPREAMIAVLVVAIGLIAAGDLSSVAHLTDAMVLISFICVNFGLMWLGIRKHTAGGAFARTRDITISSAGALMCVWLLWHGGWAWILAASAVGVLGAGWLIIRRVAWGAHLGSERWTT
jgi:amino acid transporter